MQKYGSQDPEGGKWYMDQDPVIDHDEMDVSIRIYEETNEALMKIEWCWIIFRYVWRMWADMKRQLNNAFTKYSAIHDFSGTCFLKFTFHGILVTVCSYICGVCSKVIREFDTWTWYKKPIFSCRINIIGLKLWWCFDSNYPTNYCSSYSSVQVM